MSLANHAPRGVGELLDATFTLYRSNFATILTVAMLVIVPPTVIKAIVPAEFERIVEVCGNLLVPMGQGAITVIVAAAVERSERIGVGEAFQGIAGLGKSLLAVQIVSGLMVFIGIILLVVPGVIALAWTAVGVPVVVVEQLGYSKAIERSRALARSHRGHVLGTLILAWLIALLIVVGLSIVFGMMGLAEGIVDFASEVMFAIVFPVPVIAMAFLYYDLRIRTESADIDAMISALPSV
ncbi:MAG: hypothetical protein ABIY52_16110 [Gemmatimonadaceae bacterium]